VFTHVRRQYLAVIHTHDVQVFTHVRRQYLAVIHTHDVQIYDA